MSNIPSMEEMLKSGVHFGHRASRWHPKMGAYIHGTRNGIHVIDLEKTQEMLERALQFVSEAASRGNVLFLGTKAQIKPIVKEAAEAAKMPYVTNRWLGGTLTNFSVVSLVLKRLGTLKRQRDTGELTKYTKKEQLVFEREIAELEEKIGGIQYMENLPAALIVFDVRNEMTAIREANRMKIPVVALCDTNVNPTVIDYVVPSNDDAVKAVSMMASLFADAAASGKKQAKPAVKKPVAAPKIK